jgi:hypothetical protein
MFPQTINAMYQFYENEIGMEDDFLFSTFTIKYQSYFAKKRTKLNWTGLQSKWGHIVYKFNITTPFV